MIDAHQRRGAALITGAEKGVGRAIALALAEAGFDIAVHYRSARADADEVAQTAEGQGRMAVALQADLAMEAETAALIGQANAKLGSLRLLVNAASVFERDGVETMTRASWDAHMEANLRAPVTLAQGFVAQAEKGANNLIVNIIDQRVPRPAAKYLSYALSKSTLFTLTETLAQAVGPHGVRVNTLSLVRPPETDRRLSKGGPTPDHARSETNLHGVSGALLYLVGARSVTGQVLAVESD